MSCITMSELLDRYADAELPVATRARVEAHLVACPSCRADLARLEGLRGLLQRELRDPARAADLSGLWPSIEAQLDTDTRVGTDAAVAVDPVTPAEPGGAGEAADGTQTDSGLRVGHPAGARPRRRLGARRLPFGTAAARLRAVLASKRPPAPLLAAAAAVLMLALALPLARTRIDPMDRVATVASVEGGESSSVVLLAGTPQQPPVIWVTDRGDPTAEERSL